MMERLGDGPIEEKHRKQMNDLAAFLDKIFNGEVKGEQREIAFVLMCCPFGAGNDGRVNYISNANRADVVTMMKHQIKRFEGQPDLKGNA